MAKIGLTAAILLFLAVAMGAFGTHVLSESLSAERFKVFQVATKYNFYFGLGLLGIYVISLVKPSLKLKAVFLSMLSGVVVFCGTLYLIAFGELIGKNWGFLGAITPLGGVLLMISWVLLGIRIWNDGKVAADAS